MSVQFGKLHGRQLRLSGDGNEERPGYGGGRIVEPPPGAVERMRQVLAEKGAVAAPPTPRRRQSGIKRNSQGIDTDLAAKAAAARARREKEVMDSDW